MRLEKTKLEYSEGCASSPYTDDIQAETIK